MNSFQIGKLDSGNGTSAVVIGVNIYDPSQIEEESSEEGSIEKGSSEEKSSEEVSSNAAEKNLKETSEAENTAESERIKKHWGQVFVARQSYKPVPSVFKRKQYNV